MTLSSPFPFLEALEQLAQQKVLPTALSSFELRQQFSNEVMRSSFFSAKNMLEEILDETKRHVQSIIDPQTIQRSDRITPENPQGNVTVGFDPATARLEIKKLYEKLGYDPGDARGTIQDLSSEARINLVLKTNVELAQGAGNFLKSNDPAQVEDFPCQELVRFGDRKEPRDWQQRWLIAAQVVGDVDAVAAMPRMIARKDSPIWQELGNADDGLGNPFPPFAFQSGMWVQEVSREEAVKLGVIDPQDQVRPQTIQAGEIFFKE